MTYATSTAQQAQATRTIIRIAGVPYYFSDCTSSTLDDSAMGSGVTSTHGSQTNLPYLLDISTSGGELDLRRHRVTSTTLRFTLQDDSTYMHALMARRIGGAVVTEDIDYEELSWTAENYTSLTTGTGHIGREAVTLETVDASPITITTRGILGTTAVAHPTGAEVTNQPQHWVDRKVVVIAGSYPDPTTAGWVYNTVGTYYLDASPRYVAGKWEFSASAGLERFDRPVYTGFKTANVVGVSYFTDTFTWSLELDDGTAWKDPADYAHQIPGIWLEGSGGKACFTVTSFSTPYVYIDAREDAIFAENGIRRFHQYFQACGYPPNTIAAIETSGITARTVYPCTSRHGSGNPATVAQRIMLSDLGAEANGSADVFPGTEATETAPRVRAGAGLTTSEVDTTSWTAARVHAFPARMFILGANPEESVVDIMCNDMAPLLGGYVYTTSAGKIAIRRYEPATVVSTAALTFTDHHDHADDNIKDDESLIISHVKVACDYDWAAGKWRTENIAHYTNADHVYGDRAATVDIRSRMAANDYSAISGYFMALAARFSRGARTIAAVAPWAGSSLLPGDVVKYTNARLPSLTSATDGITSQWFEVVRAVPDWTRHTVAVDLLEMPSAQLLAPVLTLGDWITGEQWNATLTNGIGAVDTEFAVAWPVSVITAAGVNRGATTIAALTSSTITFASSPAGTAAGDLVQLCNWLTSGDGTYTQTNSYNGATCTDYAFISSTAAYPVGPRHRWG